MNPIAWYRCPKCGKLALVDTSKVFTSYPPQYSYHCPHCNESGYCLCTEVEQSTLFLNEKENSYERNE